MVSLGVNRISTVVAKHAYVTEAIRALYDILKRMAGHQAKKSPLLRALRAWGNEDAA
jgi:pyruvate kinase